MQPFYGVDVQLFDINVCLLLIVIKYTGISLQTKTKIEENEQIGYLCVKPFPGLAIGLLGDQPESGQTEFYRMYCSLIPGIHMLLW